MFVSLAVRRLYLYWVLLLVPTLAIGAAALVLLKRERERLEERVAAADLARRTAIEARAQIVAENASLLVDEIQQGLLATLAEFPPARLDEALDHFEKGNPLVRATFRCYPNGSLLRPAAGKVVSTKAAEFMRRFGPLLTAQQPWNVAAMDTVAQKLLPPNAPAEAEYNVQAQNRAYENVQSVQSARQEAREVSKVNSSSALRRGDLADDMAEQKKDAAAAPTAAVRSRNEVDRSDRGGWLPWFADNELFVLGWHQPGGVGEVRGIELELSALISRLRAALPTEVDAGERYAVRNDRGAVLHEVGSESGSYEERPHVRLALSNALPHWEVVAWANPVKARATAGGWLAGATFVMAALIVTTLAGGVLLLRQARLSEAEAAQKTSFVANVSHEFKTPLTTIRLYAELLAEGRVRDREQGKDYLNTIGRETQRLARLVNNVLDFSRLEQGRKKFAIEPVRLSEEVARILDAHGPRVDEAGLALKREFPAEEVAIATDRDAVEQIVINLLDNACKYAAGGGEVVVSLGETPDGGATISVLDRGPGVPVAHRERIFEKFHRVDDTLTAEKTGAGLGLSIARQLARGLGGDLRYAAREGGGGAFVLELPAAGPKSLTS
jgi:two-component system, OmpR family, phosphate regulon sensor histidine kinase PhoR